VTVPIAFRRLYSVEFESLPVTSEAMKREQQTM
jgi:hypothetical protein